jgi:putative oxidoreductase
MATAWLIARLILGLGLAAHGAQKLFGWFGGHGLTGTGTFFAGLGFRPGRLFALAAGLGELGGGLLTAAGFLGAVGPALMITVMVVAILSVHWSHGFFADKRGVELPLVYATGAFTLAFTGPGAYSLDALLGVSGFSGPRRTWLAVAVALLLALATQVVRRATPAPSAPRA